MAGSGTSTPPASMVAAALAAAAVCGPAAAELIQFTFEGPVTAVEGTPSGIWSEVAVGQPMSIRIVFDSETPDLSPVGNMGIYDTLAYEVGIGDASTLIDTQIVIQVFTISHNYFAIGEYFKGAALWRSTLGLLDSTSTVWSDDSLPVDLSLDDFDEHLMFLEEISDLQPGGLADPLTVTASLQTLTVKVVPAPASAVLLLGGACIGRRRRRS